MAVTCLFLALSGFQSAVGQTCPGGSGTPITITNVKSNETLGYDLLLVRGAVAAGTQQVTISSGNGSTTWPVGVPQLAGTFYKGFVRLKRGANKVVVSAPGNQNACVDVTYAPNAYGNRIQLAVLIPKAVGGAAYRFISHAGEPSDLASLKKRVAFSALLQESLVGDLMVKAGKPRLAPYFVRDAQGEPDVMVLNTDKTEAELIAPPYTGPMDAAGALVRPLLDGRTRFSIYYALGPDGISFPPGELGINSGDIGCRNYLSVFAWPQNLGELIPRFSDQRTAKSLNMVGYPGETIPICKFLAEDFDNAFHALAESYLKIPSPWSDDPKDPFGRGSWPLFPTIFMTKDLDGANVTQETAAFSSATANNLADNKWMSNPRPASLPAISSNVIPSGLVPGLAYNYYQGTFDKLPDLNSMTPMSKGFETGFNLDNRARDEDFAFLFEGFLKVPTTDNYLFSITSDDGSRLLIDGVTLVDNDGLHEDVTRSFGLALDAGMHLIQVKYFNNKGGRSLSVAWESQLMPKGILAGAALLREPGATAVRMPAAPGIGPRIVRWGSDALVSLSSEKRITLEMVAPSGRLLREVFRGVLPSGESRIPLPTDAPNALLRVKEGSGGPAK